MQRGRPKIDTSSGVEAAAKRLMASPKFTAQAGTFANELLGTDKLLEGNAVAKPASQFPQFDAAMREAMAQEPAKFADYVLTKGDGTIEELLTAEYVFPTALLSFVATDAFRFRRGVQ